MLGPIEWFAVCYGPVANLSASPGHVGKGHRRSTSARPRQTLRLALLKLSIPRPPPQAKSCTSAVLRLQARGTPRPPFCRPLHTASPSRLILVRVVKGTRTTSSGFPVFTPVLQRRRAHGCRHALRQSAPECTGRWRLTGAYPFCYCSSWCPV